MVPAAAGPAVTTPVGATEAGATTCPRARGDTEVGAPDGEAPTAAAERWPEAAAAASAAAEAEADAAPPIKIFECFV